MNFNEFLVNLSVILPVFNEQKRINSTIQKLLLFEKQVLKNINKKEQMNLIFVFDGCTDNSYELIKKQTEKLQKYNITYIKYQKNKGLGFAVNKGIEQVKTSFVLVSDFDLSTPLNELEKIWRYINTYDIVVGSRWINSTNVSNTFNRKILSKLSSIIITKLLKLNILDTQCGFKLFKTVSAKKIFSKRTIDRFGFDFEILFIAKKKKFKIIEIPVKWKYEKHSTVHIIDYLKTFIELIAVLLNEYNGRYE